MQNAGLGESQAGIKIAGEQSHFWAYTLRKLDLKETCAPQCSSQHCLEFLGHGSNLDAHQQTNG